MALVGYFSTAGDLAAALDSLPPYTDYCMIINLDQSADDHPGLQKVLKNAKTIKTRAGMQVRQRFWDLGGCLKEDVRGWEPQK